MNLIAEFLVDLENSISDQSGGRENLNPPNVGPPNVGYPNVGPQNGRPQIGGRLNGGSPNVELGFDGHQNFKFENKRPENGACENDGRDNWESEQISSGRRMGKCWVSKNCNIILFVFLYFLILESNSKIS